MSGIGEGNTYESLYKTENLITKDYPGILGIDYQGILF